MGIAIVVAIIAILIIIKIIRFGLKLALGVILALVLGVTVYVCLNKPELHKPFDLNTIEYLFKINKDGSVSTTKQVTKTVYKEQNP